MPARRTRRFKTVLTEMNRIVASYALIGAILLLGGVGYAVDWWQGTSPWFLLVGLAVGILFGFYNLVATLRRR